MDSQEIQAKIGSFPHWYHQITMPDGSITPGINDTRGNLEIYDAMGLPQRMDGCRVLDIGCADGFYSFLAESRGAAEVVAVDYRLPTQSGFSIAKEILGSNVTYRTANVYDLDEKELGTFDFIFFIGVIYHLRNPLLALDGIRKLAKENAQVLVESHVIDLELQAKLQDDTGSLLPQTVSGMPLWCFYPRDTLNSDHTNKWAPTLAGLVDICDEAQLLPMTQKLFGARGAVLCKAVSDEKLDFFRKLDKSAGRYGFADIPEEASASRAEPCA